MLTKDILVLVVIGTIGVFLLIATIVLFVIRYNNKILELELARQKDLIKAEINGKEAEQTRIARGIHDAIGGNLAALNLHIQRIQAQHANNGALSNDLTKLKDLINETHETVRHVSIDLLAFNLEVYGLVYSLKELLKHSAVKETSIDNLDSDLEGSLLETEKVAIYRILQEMLNNAIRHSRCSLFRIGFAPEEDGIKVKVEFDGECFEYEQSRDDFLGLGLKNIESRIQLLGADLNFKSKNDCNFYIIAIPLHEKH